MNLQRHPIRTIAAVGAAAALTLAACGGDDDSASTTAPSATTTPPAAATTAPADVPANQPSSIIVDAQDSDGTTIIVASIDLPAPGFIAVHGDGGGPPGPVIGHSALLPAGTSTDVAVTLDVPLTADATVYPMVHIDMNSNGVYEFAPPDVTTDGPGLTADGDVAVTGGQITVTGGDSAAPGDDNVITIAGFAFSGITEVAVGTTVTVTNTDGSPHTWSADDGTFDSGALSKGESFQFTFTEPGTYEYHCNFHQSMTGTITVTG